MTADKTSIHTCWSMLPWFVLRIIMVWHSIIDGGREPFLTSCSSLELLVIEFVLCSFCFLCVLLSSLTAVCFFIYNAIQTVIILLVIFSSVLVDECGCMWIILLFNPHQSATRIGGIMISGLASSVVVWILAPVRANQKLWNWYVLLLR